MLDPERYPVADAARGGYVLEGDRRSRRHPDRHRLGGARGARRARAPERPRASRSRVVSLPSWELFEEQPESYRADVLPLEIEARVSVEAAASLGWERYVGLRGAVIGLDRFGASAPGRDGARASGLHRGACRRRGRARAPGGIDTLRGAERRFRVMTKLHDLAAAGTSPWLDNIRRGWLKSGEFQQDGRRRGRRRHVEPHDLPEGDRRQHRLRRRDRGARRHIRVGRGRVLRARDRGRARGGRPDPPRLRRLRPPRRLRVVRAAARLANDSAASIAAAPDFFGRIGRPNIYIKIPGTAEGVPAIEESIAAGINVNVTLLFSLARYEAIHWRYLRGPRAAAGGRPADRRRPLGGELLRLARRHRDRPGAARGLAASRARRRSRTPSWPTSASARSLASRPVAEAGRRRARRRSGRCGHRPGRRTPRTRTSSTSTS